MVRTFERTAELMGGKAETEVQLMYPGFSFEEDARSCANSDESHQEYRTDAGTDDKRRWK